VYAVNKIEINLTVPSIEETIAWYERVLGWSGQCDVYDAEGRCGFGSVIRGEMVEDPSGKEPAMGFNLARYDGDPAAYRREHPHWTAFIKVDDVDAVYARVAASDDVSSAAADGPPRDQPWGGRLFKMRDLNGFHLTFYQLGREPSLDEVRRRHEAQRGQA
jgi:predicted enzyme related to lactoylglutathione lyase